MKRSPVMTVLLLLLVGLLSWAAHGLENHGIAVFAAAADQRTLEEQNRRLEEKIKKLEQERVEKGTRLEEKLKDLESRLKEKETPKEETDSEETHKSESIVRIGQNVTVEQGDVVNGDIVCIGGTVHVKGKVRGDVVAPLGGIVLYSGSVIEGSAVGIFGGVRENRTAGEPKPVVKGDRVSILSAPAVAPLAGFAFSSLHIPKKTGDLLMILLLAILIPKRLEKVSSQVLDYPARSLIRGLIVYLLVVPVFLFLVITIIGIPVILLEFALVLLLWLLGYGGLSLFVGRRLSEMFPKLFGKLDAGSLVSRITAQSLIGCLAVILAGLIPVFGFIASVAVTLLGTGAAASVLMDDYTAWKRMREDTATSV
ncbi:MAG: hypothetical protein HYU64_02600 [Armatimonadetes bacterium]|nr:hypothetical protein [Armatimonadota bacterium]